MFVALFGNYLWFVRPNNNDAQAPQMLPSGVKASQGTTNASLSASGNVVASHVTEDFVFEKEYFLRSVSDFDTREVRFVAPLADHSGVLRPPVAPESAHTVANVR